jgi:ribosomal protein L24
VDLFDGDEVMIMTGKLTSFYGHIVTLTRYQTKPDNALVRTFDEDNKETFRTYNLDNLIRA